MKKLLLILLCLPMIGFGQQTYVPDDNFEQALINLGYDNVLDDYVTTANIYTVTNLQIGNQSISDLTGIEDFTTLITLNCGWNQLTSLDVSTNTALTSLYCGWNQLTSLDVSSNTALTSLYCGWNQLTSLDVSNNTALTELNCNDNQLTSLDVSNNTALTYLYCGWNQLTSLDVRNGNNTNITTFDATNNPNLTCIDVDNPSWSATNWTVVNSNIDPQQYFSNNCSGVPIYGCTDTLACNYYYLANVDDGSCGYNTASYDTLSVGASIVWNGMPLNVSGDYSVTLTNVEGCDSIANLNLTITIPSGILNVTNTEKTLLRITDILGQETPYRRNTPLFYIYDDGTVKKKIIIE